MPAGDEAQSRPSEPQAQQAQQQASSSAQSLQDAPVRPQQQQPRTPHSASHQRGNSMDVGRAPDQEVRAGEGMGLLTASPLKPAQQALKQPGSAVGTPLKGSRLVGA